jgi:hypothetical protein
MGERDKRKGRSQNLLGPVFDVFGISRRKIGSFEKPADLCYRPQPFPNETKRIEFLFELYDKYTADLFTKEKPGNKRKT